MKRASRSNVRPGCSKMIYIYIRKTNFLGGRKKRGFWIGFSMIFWYRFKALFEGLEGIRVGFRHPLEVVFSWQGSSKSRFLLFCVKMKVNDFVRTSHAKLPLLLLHTRYRWHSFPQKWWFCMGHPYNSSKHPLCYAFLQKLVDFQFWPPLPCKIAIFFFK